MQCKATNKQTKEQCRRRAVTGYTVCQVHGAGSPKQGRPGGYPKVYRANGKYSKLLPTHLEEAYQASLQDRRLLELSEQVALIDARIADLLGQMEAAPPTAPEERVKYDSIWVQVQNAIQDRRRLVESERKRLVEAGQMVTAAQLMVLLDNVYRVICEHVKDTATRQTIGLEFKRLVGSGVFNPDSNEDSTVDLDSDDYVMEEN